MFSFCQTKNQLQIPKKGLTNKTEHYWHLTDKGLAVAFIYESKWAVG